MTQHQRDQENLANTTIGVRSDANVQADKPLGFISNVSSLIVAGAVSGIPADIVAFPFCRIKTMQMTQGADPNAYQFKGTWDTSKYVYRAQGFTGYYRGLSPVLLSAVPGSTLFFMGAQ